MTRPIEDLDIVGSVELHEDAGNPEGVSLLLTPGMDPDGIACLFRELIRVDLGTEALLRHPEKTDAEFEARLDVIIAPFSWQPVPSCGRAAAIRSHHPLYGVSNSSKTWGLMVEAVAGTLETPLATSRPLPGIPDHRHPTTTLTPRAAMP